MTAFVALAWADHGGPLSAAPMGALGSLLVFGGVAVLVCAVVVVMVTVLTRGRPPQGGPGG